MAGKGQEEGLSSHEDLIMWNAIEGGSLVMERVHIIYLMGASGVSRMMAAAMITISIRLE